MIKEEIQHLFSEQLENWEAARLKYEALSGVKVKTFGINGNTYKVQFNSARITSSAAKVDAKSIQERKCFLCQVNLPAQQKGIPFKDQYIILVNPFPIFPKHLTIPELNHTDQLISGRMGDMLDLAEALDDFVIFYNGPKCGASAPDHFHYQAGNKGFLPIEKEWHYKKAGKVIETGNAVLWYLDDAPRTTLVIESADKSKAVEIFELIYNSMEVAEPEPMMNILAWYENGKYIVCVFPRKKHRPDCYFAEGEDNLLISPASVDLGGVFITPQEKDFEKITEKDINSILAEICLEPSKFHKLRQEIKQRL